MVVPNWGQPRTFGEGNRRGSCSTESAESFRPLAAALGQLRTLKFGRQTNSRQADDVKSAFERYRSGLMHS